MYFFYMQGQSNRLKVYILTGHVPQDNKPPIPLCTQIYIYGFKQVKLDSNEICILVVNTNLKKSNNLKHHCLLKHNFFGQLHLGSM